MGLFLTVFWWFAVNSGNSRFGGFYSRLGPQEFPFSLLRELAHTALIGLVVAVRKRHLVGTIEKIPGSTGITGNPVMAARSKAMSIAGACARKRWFRQTHSSHRSVCRARARALHAGRRHGRREPAAVEPVEARRLSPDGRYSSLARLRAVYTWGVSEDPRLARSHLFRRNAQGRHAGRVTEMFVNPSGGSTGFGAGRRWHGNSGDRANARTPI